MLHLQLGQFSDLVHLFHLCHLTHLLHLRKLVHLFHLVMVDTSELELHAPLAGFFGSDDQTAFFVAGVDLPLTAFF